MAKTKTTEQVSVQEDEQYLVYNMYITTLNITIEDGGKLVMQQGKPTPPPTPPNP